MRGEGRGEGRAGKVRRGEGREEEGRGGKERGVEGKRDEKRRGEERKKVYSLMRDFKRK